MIIGIIGEAGSGKTYNTRYFAKRMKGLHIEGDQLGHEALEDPSIKGKILQTFGRQVLNEQGEINRKALGEIVFGDHQELLKLNAISHPFILEKIKAIIEENQGVYDYIFIEGAALIEAGVNDLCHLVAYLYAPEDLRVQRLVKGRELCLEKAKSIVEAQKKSDFFRKIASVTFDTSRGNDKMREEIVEYFRSLHETYS